MLTVRVLPPPLITLTPDSLTWSPTEAREEKKVVFSSGVVHGLAIDSLTVSPKDGVSVSFSRGADDQSFIIVVKPDVEAKSFHGVITVNSNMFDHGKPFSTTMPVDIE